MIKMGSDDRTAVSQNSQNLTRSHLSFIEHLGKLMSIAQDYLVLFLFRNIELLLSNLEESSPFLYLIVPLLSDSFAIGLDLRIFTTHNQKI